MCLELLVVTSYLFLKLYDYAGSCEAEQEVPCFLDMIFENEQPSAELIVASENQVQIYSLRWEII